MKNKGYSESNAFYFVMLSHNFWGRCGWYSSIDWTFLPVFHYTLLLCDRWQQWGSLKKRYLTWKRIWSKGVTEFLRAENMAPIDTHQRLLNVYGDQTADVSTVRQWMVRFSSGDSGSPPLVHIFTSTACRLWFITDKNTWQMVVTVLKKSVL